MRVRARLAGSWCAMSNPLRDCDLRVPFHRITARDRTYLSAVLSGRYSQNQRAQISIAHIGHIRRCGYSPADQPEDDAIGAAGTPWVLPRLILSLGSRCGPCIRSLPLEHPLGLPQAWNGLSRPLPRFVFLRLCEPQERRFSFEFLCELENIILMGSNFVCNRCYFLSILRISLLFSYY